MKGNLPSFCGERSRTAVRGKPAETAEEAYQKREGRAMELVTVDIGDRSYRIEIEAGSLDRLGSVRVHDDVTEEEIRAGIHDLFDYVKA